MKRLYLAALMLILVTMVMQQGTATLSAQEDEWAAWIPEPAKASQPGTYELTTPRVGIYSPEGVPAALYIPDTPAPGKGRSLLVFYHGMAYGNPLAYRRAVDELSPWARDVDAVLLCVQNVWGLDESYDAAAAILSSCDATMDYIEALVRHGVVSADLVFATGFSAGGFVALCMGIYRPDLVRGVGDFKGNFYPETAAAVLENAALWETHPSFRAASWKKGDQLFYLCTGGDADAPRVLAQIGEAEAFLKKNGRRPVIERFPGEGHVLSPDNLAAFWKEVRKLL